MTRTLPLRGVRRSREGCSLNSSPLRFSPQSYIQYLSNTPPDLKVGLPSRGEFCFLLLKIFATLIHLIPPLREVASEARRWVFVGNPQSPLKFSPQNINIFSQTPLPRLWRVLPSRGEFC